jgi:hypothetical protein
MHTRLSLLVALLSVAVVSGCTTATVGIPHAASSDASPTDQSGTEDDLPSDGAPKVDHPLDVSHFEEHPCDALKAEDAQTLNVSAPGQQDENGVGLGCGWRNSQTGGSLGLDFFTSDKRGLSSAYRDAKNGYFSYFEPVDDIEDYPAVAYSTKEKTPTARCVVAVGVSDQVFFAVTVALSFDNIGKKDPCEAAAGAAGMLVRTMKEAA